MKYKVVILPAAVAISDAQAKQLEAFVKRGGTLIADFAPGRYDGHGKRRSSPVMNRLFAPCNGPIDITYAQLPKLGGKFKVAEKGVPLMQEKTYGKGRTVNFNFSVSDYHFIPTLTGRKIIINCPIDRLTEYLSCKRVRG